MTNNIDKIRDLLEFRSDDDFYFLQILQRKKDNKTTNVKVNGSNNNARSIKVYYVKSLEHFDFIVPEIIELCKVFGARAGINLNRRSFKKSALQHIKKAVDQVLNNDFKKAHKAYSTVVGAFNNETDKRWIIDIDEEYNADYAVELMSTINDLRPVGDKIIANIPSKSGYHLITRPFQLDEFKRLYPDLDVHKNNPTNIFIP